MAQQWLSASDPFWSQFGNVAARDPESGEFTNPYISTIRGLQAPENWRGVARQLGYQGPFETQVISTDPGEGGGGLVNVPAPEFLQFIQQKQAEGYDFVTKADQINKDRQTIGLRTPTGEVINQTPVKVSGFGDFFKEFVLPAVAAYGAVNFLGPRLEGLTNALSGGGQITAADLASIPTNAMGQVSQPSALGAEGAGAMYTDVSMAPGTETGLFGEQFHPIKNYPYSDVTLNALAESAASVTTPAAAATDAANAMQLSPVTQLQPITQAPGFSGMNALDQALIDMGAGATNVGASAASAGAGLSAQALDAALAGAGGGAGAGAGAGAGGAGAGEDFLSGMSDVSGVEGSGVSGTGVLTKGTNIPSEVLGVSSDLDKILTFLKSPAGASALSGLGSLLGGVIQAGAAEGASEQQAEAARNALALSQEMFEYQKNLLAPYQKYGTAALERLSGALGLEGAAKPQQMLEMDPGYGFRLGEGLKALERMQAARGNMLSGGALKAGQRYAQDYASGEYSNAYNRLANIAGLGQTAGTQLGGAAQQFGQTAGNIMGQEANALAAGRIGRGSAYGNAIQGGLNAYSNYLNQQQQNQLFRDIFGRTAIGG